MLDKAASRGQENKHPLSYKENLDLCKLTATNNGLSDLMLMQGDSYAGAKKAGSASRQDIEKMQQQMSGFSKELASIKQQQPNQRQNQKQKQNRGNASGSSNNNNSSSSGSNYLGPRGKSGATLQRILGKKLGMTCQSYNLGLGDCSPPCGKKHECNIQLEDGSLCWAKHPAIQHKDKP